MHDLRVALAQTAPKLGELRDNLELHLETCRLARREKAGVVVFPELSLTGYLLRDQVPDVALRIDDPLLKPLLRASRNLGIIFGFVEESDGHRFYNAAAYLSGGRVVHVHRKIYLPTYGMFDEGRDFAAGDKLRRFDAPWGPAGLLVCEDAWHPTSAWLLAQEGAEVVFVLSAGPSRGTKAGRGITSVAVWNDIVRATAQMQTAFVVYVNRVGFDDGLSFGGGSTAVDPFGRTITALPPLEAGLAVADLEAEVLRRARNAYPLLRDENVDLVWRELDRIRRTRYELPEDEPRAGRAVLRRRSLRR
jgi:predicted amidohydrolase